MVRAALIRRTQLGVALITAMLIAALAAAVVATLAAGQGQWIRSVELRRDQVQAQAVVLAGLVWARQVMELDARAGSIDHLGEPWSLPLPPTPLESGSIEGTIVDAQGLVNLNNLAADDVHSRADRARLARLFAQVGMDPSAIDALADWIDGDDVPREGGAETAAYAGTTASRVPPNRPLLRRAEAIGARGVEPGRLTALGRWVTALPTITALNVNTAAPEVLAATVNGLDAESLAALVADRARKPYATVAEFRSRLPSGARIDDTSTLDVKSDYFLVTVRARQGETVAQGRALLRRAGGEARAVWQTVE